MVAGANRDAIVADFRAAVEKAIAEGTTLEQFRKDFDTDKFLGRVTGKSQPIQEGAAPPSGAYFPTPMTGHDPNYPIPTTP